MKQKLNIPDSEMLKHIIPIILRSLLSTTATQIAVSAA